MYDTCNAEKSEVALCSVLSTYSRDCAAAGVYLKGWRQGICGMHPKIPWVGGSSFRRAQVVAVSVCCAALVSL